MYRQKLREISRQSNFPVEKFGSDHFVLTHTMIGELRELSYFERWRKAMTCAWFNMKMADGSLFLFCEGDSPSYAYLHCPLEIISFAQFLSNIGEQDSPNNRRRYGDEYEQFLSTASKRNHVTPIRFDYDTLAYRPGVHPAAHIHIGLQNSVRISTNRMDAVSFVLFVMRQMYPESWSNLLSKSNKDYFVGCIRAPSTKIPTQYFSELDRIELHFR